jgi:glycerol-3-phosphate dehydrogenase (NAD(P)+)
MRKAPMGTDEMTNIGVIGAGAWGTTLANLLCEKGHAVDLWVREPDVCDQIREEGINSTFLPGIRLRPELNPVTSIEQALLDKDLVAVVVPSHVFREVLGRMKPHLGPGMSLITGTKGIENESQKTMSQVAESVLPVELVQNFACLAGPSFAREVSLKCPTAVTIGCRNVNHGKWLQRVFYTEHFRVYTSEDLTGVELCGAIKNVIAIAAGTADALHFGHNARAALITRGLAEMTRLGVAMKANPSTFAGLAGMGDLVLTCTGDLSRNRTVGLKIGQGMKLQEIVEGMTQVAEGVKTCVSVYKMSRDMGVEMPITNEVYEILYQGKDPRIAVRDLMTRELKKEVDA